MARGVKGTRVKREQQRTTPAHCYGCRCEIRHESCKKDVPSPGAEGTGCCAPCLAIERLTMMVEERAEALDAELRERAVQRERELHDQAMRGLDELLASLHRDLAGASR